MPSSNLPPSRAVLLFLVLFGCHAVACSPATPLAPTPTPLPPIPSATGAPPTATATGTATLTPTTAPTAPSTATLVPPTDTPTPVPTTTPPPTITRVPTRRPTDTLAPAVGAPPACPAWYQPPQPGKGVLVIANEMKPNAQFQNLPGSSPSAQIAGASADAPTRLMVQIDPGQYTFSYSSDAGGGNLFLSIAAGEMKLLQLFLRPSGVVNSRWPWVSSTTTYVADSYLALFSIPYGCPGGLPPTPTPPPQCPAWFATPAPDKAVLVVENRSTEPFDVTAPDSGKVVASVPPTTMDGPGRGTLTLAPGHVELETTTGKRIVVDLAAGTSAVAVHPETRQTPALLLIYGLTPPPACPGYVVPAPPPPPQCPDWFQRPLPGKGVLIIENYAPRSSTVVGIKGVEIERVLQQPRGDQIDRMVLQLNPGLYEFGAWQGSIFADITEGQAYAFAMTWNGWANHNATLYVLPGCQ